jgi:hypothetical protein
MEMASWQLLVDWNGDGDFLDANEDISAYYRTLEWSYGRNYASELTGLSTNGVLTVVLDNRSGIFSSFNAGSAIYGNILPRRKVQLKSTYSGTTLVQ